MLIGAQARLMHHNDVPELYKHVDSAADIAY